MPWNKSTGKQAVLSKKIMDSRGVLAGLLAVGMLIIAALVFAWLRFAPVSANDGWQYRVVQEDLDRITALAQLADGSLVASLSPKQGAGKPGEGRLVQLEMVSGSAGGGYKVLADRLYKPAGLLPYKGGIVVTQEFSGQPVLWWRDGQMLPLLTLVKPESIAVTAAGRWLVIEDASDGRLLEINPEDVGQKILFQGFTAGEGLCIGRQQRIFVVDSKGNDLLEYVDGKMKKLGGKLNGPGFLRCTADGIWITEDVTNNGRLIFYDYQEFHVVASRLHSPQSVLEYGENSVLVAEQGRSRLLEFSKR